MPGVPRTGLTLQGDVEGAVAAVPLVGDGEAGHDAAQARRLHPFPERGADHPAPQPSLAGDDQDRPHAPRLARRQKGLQLILGLDRLESLFV